MNYNLENLGKSKRLTIVNNVASGCSTFFIGGIGLAMFLAPILMILFVSKEITFGSIIVCLIAWLISGYFIRLYLWNKYGEEVFIISKNALETYNNYGLFRDNHNIYKSNKIELLFFIDENIIYVDRLDKKHFIDSERLSKVGFQLNKEVITSHKELPISTIIEIAYLIKS